MTQQALAERIGVTRQTVNAIEAGKYSPSLEVAFRIASVFGVELNDVFSWEPDPEPARVRRKKARKVPHSPDEETSG